MRHTPFKVVQNKMLLKTGILILSLAAAIACGTTGAEENRPDIPGKIVFSAKDGGDDPTFQIFTMNADGSDIHQLTDGRFSIEPAWSPDGSQIAFARSSGSTAGGSLWVMDADSGNQQSLVTNPRTGSPQFGSNPAWSPDGTKLAFDLCLNCERGGNNFEIFVADLQAGTIDTLTRHPASDSHPTWSPDGSRIAYARSTGSTAGDALWVMEADGSNKEPLVVNPQTGSPQLGNQPAWSPNGNKLAFDRCVNCAFGGKNVDIFVADLQTGVIDTLVQHSARDGGPVWSPDGNQIAFITNRDYLDADTLRLRIDLYSVSIDEKELKRMTFNGNVGSYGWLSTDSISYVLFDRNTNLKDLIMLEVESGELRAILTDLQVSQFWTIWDPAGRQFLSIEKKHNEVPVTLTLFDLEGNTIEEIMLTDPVLKTAVGFEWKVIQ